MVATPATRTNRARRTGGAIRSTDTACAASRIHAGTPPDRRFSACRLYPGQTRAPRRRMPSIRRRIHIDRPSDVKPNRRPIAFERLSFAARSRGFPYPCAYARDPGGSRPVFSGELNNGQTSNRCGRSRGDGAQSGLEYRKPWLCGVGLQPQPREDRRTDRRISRSQARAGPYARGVRRVARDAAAHPPDGEGGRSDRRDDRGAQAAARQGRRADRRRQHAFHRHDSPQPGARAGGAAFHRHGRVGGEEGALRGPSIMPGASATPTISSSRSSSRSPRRRRRTGSRASRTWGRTARAIT